MIAKRLEALRHRVGLVYRHQLRLVATILDRGRVKGLFRRYHESSFTAYLILLNRLTFHHWTVLLSPDHEKIKACNVQLVSLTQGKGPTQRYRPGSTWARAKFATKAITNIHDECAAVILYLIKIHIHLVII